jgi:hypothetical protein
MSSHEMSSHIVDHEIWTIFLIFLKVKHDGTTSKSVIVDVWIVLDFFWMVNLIYRSWLYPPPLSSWQFYSDTSLSCAPCQFYPVGLLDWLLPLAKYSKIPLYPKLLFQRENALASFWVRRVLVTQPKPSRVDETFFKFDRRHFFSHNKSFSTPYRELSV